MSSIIDSIFFPWGDKDELHDDSDPQASVGSYSFDDGQSLETFDINGVGNKDCDMFSSYQNEYDKYGEAGLAKHGVPERFGLIVGASPPKDFEAVDIRGLAKMVGSTHSGQTVSNALDADVQ